MSRHIAMRMLASLAALMAWAAFGQAPEAATPPVVLADISQGLPNSVRSSPRVVIRDASLVDSVRTIADRSPVMLAVPFAALLATFGFFFWRSHSRASHDAPPRPAAPKRTAPQQRAATERSAAGRTATGSWPAQKVTMPRRDSTEPPIGKPRVRITKPVELEPLAWDASPVPAEGPITLAKPAAANGEPALDPVAARIRDRYLAARFPGALRNAADLADAAAVIKAARLYFEDGFVARAHEILDLAAEAHPEVDSPWLAALEIAFLTRDPERYVTLAHVFHRAHPESPDWAEVMRLGQRIAPMHPRFAGEAGAARDFDHFGPWPHLPNWIGANWDLTGEVASVELRARLMASAPGGVVPLPVAA